MAFSFKLTHVKTVLSRFLREEKGTVSIEFVGVAMFFGILMTSTAWLAQNENASTQTMKVTSTVANLLTQSPILNASVIDGSLLAGRAMLGDEVSKDLEVYVAGLQISENGTPKVIWSRGRCLKNLQLPRPNSTYLYKDKLASELLARDLSFEGGRLKFNKKFFVIAHARLSHQSMQTVADLPQDHVYEYIHAFAPRRSVETACIRCDNLPALPCT